MSGLLADVQAGFLIGDENPMREPERWRREIASRIRIPFWTVDTEVVVPSKLMEKAQYGAYTIRPRLYRLLPEYLHPYENLKAEHEWKRPRGFHADSVYEDMTREWKNLDRSVAPVEMWRGARTQHLSGLRRLAERCSKRMTLDGTIRRWMARRACRRIFTSDMWGRLRLRLRLMRR